MEEKVLAHTEFLDEKRREGKSAGILNLSKNSVQCNKIHFSLINVP